MEPNAFVAEVYRRMAMQRPVAPPEVLWEQMKRDPQVRRSATWYKNILPADKTAPILELGFGTGWFLAACVSLGYTNIAAADFGIDQKAYVKRWSPSIILHPIETDIGDFLKPQPEQYQFIHMSHVIEHIPKYSLFWVTDSVYRALRPGGMLCLRTPNMEGPSPNSSLYVTLAHEYGFCGSNLTSLLSMCGFEDIQLLPSAVPGETLRQRIGTLLKWPFLAETRLRHRLFGVNEGGQFGPELVATAIRGAAPPLFDERYR
jgi:2-polyprenyl-3-methyl-5-hydroxy-6-metoxy-1,4-benzoquinol methylase